MLRVYTCIVQEHDLRLVVLAAIVCALASFTAINLVHHVRRSTGQMRQIWLGVAATASGFGIWATHFIAMLAFSPGIPSGYNVALTLLSLVAAIVLTGIGLGVALSRTLPGASWLGGAIVGGGIAAMHYTGMAAFEIQGRIVWDPVLVIVSIAAGALIGAAATRVGLIEGERKWKYLRCAAAHRGHMQPPFHGDGARPRSCPIPGSWCRRPPSRPAGLPSRSRFASLAILLLACCGLALDIRDRGRLEQETDRMRGLANAAVEGLLVCDGETIATANRSFASLTGIAEEQVAGAPLSSFLPDEAVRTRLLERSGEVIETVLRHSHRRHDPGRARGAPGDLCQPAASGDRRPRHPRAQEGRGRSAPPRAARFADRPAQSPQLQQQARPRDRDRRGEWRAAWRCCASTSTASRRSTICSAMPPATRCCNRSRAAAGGVLGEDQMLARLGGDEFAVIAPGLPDPAAAGRIAESIIDAFRAENEDAPNGGLVSGSIGIAIYPNDAVDRESLMSHADTALYRAKVEGRGTYRFFEAAMGAEVKERRHIEHDLLHAISRGELRLAYQPQKQLTTGEVIGFEALLRWQHPRARRHLARDLHPDRRGERADPADRRMGAAHRLPRGRDAGTRPLIVAVNVSAVQLHSAQFAQLVHEILLQTGLAPHRLELEITETALVRDKNRALATLRQLKNLGVRIAMDDFGTGYSSLSNLRAFPFDKIKIDGSFIRSVDSNDEAATIVRAVLGLGRGLGLPVLAEGVETAGELAFLAAESCTEGQGYFLGRPGPIENYRDLVRHHPSIAGERRCAPTARQERRCAPAARRSPRALGGERVATLRPCLPRQSPVCAAAICRSQLGAERRAGCRSRIRCEARRTSASRVSALDRLDMRLSSPAFYRRSGSGEVAEA